MWLKVLLDNLSLNATSYEQRRDFLILATQVPWQWAKVTLIVWSVLTFIGIIVLKTKVAIEIKNAES
jgi:hypothetical protein